MDHYRMNRSGCGCGQNQQMNRSGAAGSCAEPVPADQMPVAMGYVPMQQFEQTYEPELGLKLGTIFPELAKPFCGKGGAPCK